MATIWQNILWHQNKFLLNRLMSQEYLQKWKYVELMFISLKMYKIISKIKNIGKI